MTYERKSTKKSKNCSVNFFTIQNKCIICAAVKKGLFPKDDSFVTIKMG